MAGHEDARVAVRGLVEDEFRLLRSVLVVAEVVEQEGVVVLVVAFGWLGFLLPYGLPWGEPVPYAVAANLLLILLIFGTITLGIVKRREALVNVGIVFFVIDLTTRYIELTVDMLDTSLAFIVGGLLLLGVGYAMEQARRRLLRQFGMMEVIDES